MPDVAGIIRQARIGDLDDLEALENSVFPGDRLSRRSLRYYAGSRTADMLVLEIDGAVAGDAIVAYRQGSLIARLYSLAIRADLAGRGLGRRLLESCEAAATMRGRTDLRLEVRDDNPAAIRFYESSGYRHFGCYEDYYEDGASALRFGKALT